MLETLGIAISTFNGGLGKSHYRTFAFALKGAVNEFEYD